MQSTSAQTTIPNRLQSFRLPRTLSLAETWGYGLVGGPAGWLGLVAAMHLALGAQAIWVWIPATLVGIVINCQVKQIARRSMTVAGGTPNYIARLLAQSPNLARYGAIGYLVNWIAAYALCASQLGDLLVNSLPFLHESVPLWLGKGFFLVLPLLVALNGTRALSILHLVVASVALVLLVTFSVQGLGWLGFGAGSPGLWGGAIAPIGFGLWAKWFFFASYATYSGETTSAFLADSRRPQSALRILDATSGLMVVVFLGASWVVSRIVPTTGVEENILKVLELAAAPFWGSHAPLLVTTMIATSALLVQATGLALSSRVLYQLSQDQFLAPVFQAMSRRGVAGPALVLTFGLACVYYAWGQWNLTQLVVAGNVAWFVAFTLFHGGLWLRRRQEDNLWPWLALGLCGIEAAVLWVGGSQWGLESWAIGLLCPLGVIGLNGLIQKLQWPICRPQWWSAWYQRSSPMDRDPLAQQTLVIISLMLGALLMGWVMRDLSLASLNTRVESRNVLVMVSLVMLLVGIAIACWTTFPTTMALTEAKQAADHLLENAQDAIMVVNAQGQIQRANPIASHLLGQSKTDLRGQALGRWISELDQGTEAWPRQLEVQWGETGQTFQISISTPKEESWGEVVVILHDISDRYRAEELLRTEAQQLAQQLLQSEKMSSLGQMVAGLAHEINNPISFIHGNLDYARSHTEALLEAIRLYEGAYPEVPEGLREALNQLDVEFVQADLPKVLGSMEMGSHRIHDLISSLRNFARLDESELKTVDLHEGLDSTLLLLQYRLNETEKRQAIAIKKDYGVLPPLECYAGQLNQVFMHLLNNAIDALDEAGKLNSELIPGISISTFCDEDGVRVEVVDNGMGVPEAVRSRIFDPFFTTKAIGQGTGLGLSVSYQIVTKLHEGALTCEAHPGGGSCFTIVIPKKGKVTG